MTDLQFFFASFVILLAVDFIFIAARTSFTQTSHARLLSLRDEMEAQVNRTSAMLLMLPRLKSSLNFTLVLGRFLLAGSVLFWISRQPFGQSILASSAVLLTFAFLVFIFEWLVEREVTKDPEMWAIRLTPFIKAWVSILSVLLILPLGLPGDANGGGDTPPMVTVTEDELKTLVDAGQEEGVFEQVERRMIYSIFQLGDTLAREIMVPRIDMLAIEVTTPLPEAVDAFLRSGHSRVPVFEESVDNTLGLLYAKDMLRVWREGNHLESLRELLRPAYFVPEAKKVGDLLTELQSQRIHMAIVVDEYGGVAGLVTLEDIVEEIVGEIRDEYDQAEEAPFQVLKNGDYLFQGRVDVDDFNEIMGADLPKEEADTIGGLIYSRLGRVPTVGESVQSDYMLLTVEQVSGRRIRKVRAHRLPPDFESEEEKHEVRQ